MTGLFSRRWHFSVGVFVWGVVWGVGTATQITRGIQHQHIKVIIILREVGFSLIFAQLFFFFLLFFHSHACLSALPADTTDPLSSTVFHFGSAAVCLVLSLYLSAPPIACDVLLYIHIPMQRVRSKTVRFTPRSLAVDPSRESLTSAKPRHHLSLSGVTWQSWKCLSAGNSARSSLVRYVNS